MPSRQYPGSTEGDLPTLLFLERAAVVEPVHVEVDRPMAMHPRVTGFWRGGDFYRVVKIVETRYEYGETYLRIVTDRGCVDLRRARVTDPTTLRTRTEWELSAELDAIEIPRPK
jgi:hypothetical protein